MPRQKHLRVRGEDFSPGPGPDDRCRNTSACAEKTAGGWGRWLRGEKKLRVRGEDAQGNRARTGLWGTPPRTRRRPDDLSEVRST